MPRFPEFFGGPYDGKIITEKELLRQDYIMVTRKTGTHVVTYVYEYVSDELGFEFVGEQEIEGLV